MHETAAGRHPPRWYYKHLARSGPRWYYKHLARFVCGRLISGGRHPPRWYYKHLARPGSDAADVLGWTTSDGRRLGHKSRVSFNDVHRDVTVLDLDLATSFSINHILSWGYAMQICLPLSIVAILVCLRYLCSYGVVHAMHLYRWR